MTSLPAVGDRTPLFTRAFVLASVAHFLHGIAVHAYLHLPGFLQAIGATEFEIGVMAFAMAIAALVCRPFLGRAMDLRGRRPVIIVSGILHVAVCLAYLTVHSVGPWIYIVRAAHGIASAMMYSALFTYAADIVPETRRTEGIALFGISGLVPIALGSLLGDLVLTLVSYRELFLLTVVASGLGLVLSFPLKEPPSTKLAEPSRGFFSAAFQRNLVTLWFLGTAFAISLSPIFIFLKTYVLETGLGSVGLFMGMYSLSAAVLRIAFGWVPDRFGPKRAVVPAMSALALGLIQLAFAQTDTDVAIAGVLCGLGHGFTFPIIAGLVVTRSGSGDPGPALSLFTAVFDAGFLLGGPLFGRMIQSVGYGMAFQCAAATALGGVVIFVVWDYAIDTARRS